MSHIYYLIYKYKNPGLEGAHRVAHDSDLQFAAVPLTQGQGVTNCVFKNWITVLAVICNRFIEKWNTLLYNNNIIIISYMITIFF